MDGVTFLHHRFNAMNDVVEWTTAVVLILIILGVFLLTGTLILGAVVVVIIAFAAAIFMDVLLAPFRWLSSLFSSTKEKRTKEEETDD